MSKKQNKKSTSKKSIKNKLPTLAECGGFTYHSPWNKSKYKKACEEKKCFFNYKTYGLLGSYCEDPITVTNRNILGEQLHDIFKLAVLELDQLKAILLKCNMADKKYYQDCLDIYRKKRIEALKRFVVNCEENLILKLGDGMINKFIKHAKEEGLSNLKDADQIKYYRFLFRRNCFNSKLGNIPARYKMKSWNEITKILNNCGIEENSIFYEQARLHFETYSCNSPYYHIIEMPMNSENNQCENDCDCRSTRRCEFGKCVDEDFPHIIKNYRRATIPNLELPRGNWTETAREIHLDRNILMAKLKKKDGSYAYDKVIFNPQDSFSNYDGKFKLDYITKLPGGTWKESAKDIQIKNGIISALLKDKKGVYNHDFIILNTDNCLKNNDGKFEVVIC